MFCKIPSVTSLDKRDSLDFKVNVKNAYYINPLNTKRRVLYLNIEFVPRSKHFSSRL